MARTGTATMPASSMATAPGDVVSRQIQRLLIKSAGWEAAVMHWAEPATPNSQTPNFESQGPEP